MTTAAALRIQNLELLITEAGTLEKVASQAGTSSVYLSQVRNGAPDQKTGRPRELGTRMARRLEAAFFKPEGWMDAPQSQAREVDSSFVLADALSSLGPQARHEALEFLKYKLERADPPIGQESLDRYRRAFEAFARLPADKPSH